MTGRVTRLVKPHIREPLLPALEGSGAYREEPSRFSVHP
jgi:hypothetical protein